MEGNQLCFAINTVSWKGISCVLFMSKLQLLGSSRTVLVGHHNIHVCESFNTGNHCYYGKYSKFHLILHANLVKQDWWHYSLRIFGIFDQF